MNASAHRLSELPILILYPHSRCNCRCIMCDIWKRTEAEEISESELLEHLRDIERLKVRQVVFSGGEPLMHSDLFRLARPLHERGITTTLLTTGLLLDARAAAVAACFDEVIVSLDGPEPVHDHIRRVPGAFAHLRAGVHVLRQAGCGVIGARSTVQRENFRQLDQTVAAAAALGLDWISFLAADVTSEAFNRPGGRALGEQRHIALDVAETAELDQVIDELIAHRRGEIDSRFVREAPEKLRAIVAHFRALNGAVEPRAPKCNAPWVSVVVESNGEIRPCFFHPVVGNLRLQGLEGGLNSPRAVAFRASLDIASDPICRRCVCSLDRPTPTGGSRPFSTSAV
jgi:MoaA/NifB/PqqE/SkfB family radical SAM enzyme